MTLKIILFTLSVCTAFISVFVVQNVVWHTPYALISLPLMFIMGVIFLFPPVVSLTWSLALGVWIDIWSAPYASHALLWHGALWAALYAFARASTALSTTLHRVISACTVSACGIVMMAVRALIEGMPLSSIGSVRSVGMLILVHACGAFVLLWRAPRLPVRVRDQASTAV